MKQLFGARKVIGTFEKQVPRCEVDDHQIHPVIPCASLVCINRILGETGTSWGSRGKYLAGQFRFLGNCPTIPPLSHYFSLSEK